jgi:hypothetical protein
MKVGGVKVNFLEKNIARGDPPVYNYGMGKYRVSPGSSLAGFSSTL